MERKHTLLFVDDEQNILNALRRLFRREGHQILLATSGREGLELLQDNAVSLIVSDQRMPEMIGAEFLARSRKVSPHSIRIMLTGYSDIEAATQAINEGGIYRYITKPWDDEQLRMTVREALERFELEQRNRELTEELKEKNAQLEEFNARLEQRVRERTRELQLKVKELEGKDRIAQHMLTIHPLEETLELVLETLSDVLELDKAIIYLNEEGEFKPTAAIGISAPRSYAGQDVLNSISPTAIHQRVFERVRERREPVNVKDPKGHPISPFAVVPILRGEEILGCIETANHRSEQTIADEELQSLASFALQAAVAISDAQTHQDFGRWKSELDDVLREVDQLDDLDP